MDKNVGVLLRHKIQWSIIRHKKNEIMPFNETWMDLEIVIMTEVSQRKTNTVYHLYVESKKRGTNRPIKKKKLANTKQKKGCQRGKVVQGGVNQVLGINMYTLLYKE